MRAVIADQPTIIPHVRNRLPCSPLLTILSLLFRSSNHCTDTRPSSTTDRHHFRSNPSYVQETGLTIWPLSTR